MVILHEIFDYEKNKGSLELGWEPALLDVFNECEMYISHLLEEFWMNCEYLTVDEYDDFFHSSFAKRVKKYHLFSFFKLGWKEGFFTFGRVKNYKEALENESNKFIEDFVREWEEFFLDKDMALVQFWVIIDAVIILGKESGKKTRFRF